MPDIGHEKRARGRNQADSEEKDGPQICAEIPPRGEERRGIEQRRKENEETPGSGGILICGELRG